MADETNVTVDTILNEFRRRRMGILKALTIDVKKLREQCNLERDGDLSLHGLENETWELRSTLATASYLPNPMDGINYFIESKQTGDWLHYVAAHSDAWLLAVAFFQAAHNRCDTSQRKRLFRLLSTIPSMVEIVSKYEQAPPQEIVSKCEQAPHANTAAKANRKDAGETSKVRKGDDEQEDSICGTCGLVYEKDEFWIACDMCSKWYHGACQSITPTVAEHIGNYECIACWESRSTEQ